MGCFPISFSRPSVDEVDIPPFITIDGKIKKNKWNIPAILNNEEKKFLIEVKKKAYKLDESCCCGCCVGWDPLVGFIPIIGDFAGAGLSFYLIHFIKSSKLIETKRVQIMIREMTFNVIKDAAVGFVPLVGDLIDVFYKANTYNASVFQRYLVDQAKLRSIVKDNHKVEVITHNSDDDSRNNHSKNRQ